MESAEEKNIRVRIDTRFNEYIKQAAPEMRPLLAELRDDLLGDLAWVVLRSNGEGSLSRGFFPYSVEFEDLQDDI